MLSPKQLSDRLTALSQPHELEQDILICVCASCEGMPCARVDLPCAAAPTGLLHGSMYYMCESALHAVNLLELPTSTGRHLRLHRRPNLQHIHQTRLGTGDVTYIRACEVPHAHVQPRQREQPKSGTIKRVQIEATATQQTPRVAHTTEPPRLHIKYTQVAGSP